MPYNEDTILDGKLRLTFGDVTVLLPSDDVKGSWLRLQKYMNLYFQFEEEDNAS